MDYAQYIKDATRTESRIDAVTTSPTDLRTALEIFTKAGQVLDLYKRQIFYKKDFADQALADLMADIHALSAPKDRDQNRADVAIDSRVLHASMGFATESGEILEAVIDHLDGKDFDTVNFMEEMGDINWYQAIAMDATGLTLDDTCARNIAKLKARFPNKFTETDAIDRNLDKERGILEGSKS